MSSTENLTLVDDLDSRIQYSTGWQVVTGGQEVDGTKHGASQAGMTATFDFTGTFIEVKGSLGSIDVYGIPTTTYAIDGTVVGNYTAPVIQPGGFQLNVSFFTSDTLEPAAHRLVITNVNGTAPNVYWLDYILFSPSTLPSSSASSTAASTSSSSSGTSTSTTSSSATAAPSSASSSGSKHVGAILGGVVGGVVVLGLVLLSMWRRHRRTTPGVERRHSILAEVQPYVVETGDVAVRESLFSSSRTLSRHEKVLLSPPGAATMPHTPDGLGSTSSGWPSTSVSPSPVAASAPASTASRSELGNERRDADAPPPPYML